MCPHCEALKMRVIALETRLTTLQATFNAAMLTFGKVVHNAEKLARENDLNDDRLYRDPDLGKEK